MVSNDPHHNPDDFSPEDFPHDGSNLPPNYPYAGITAFDLPAEGAPASSILNNPDSYTGFDFGLGPFGDIDFPNGAQPPLAYPPLASSALHIDDVLNASAFLPAEHEDHTHDDMELQQSGLGLMSMQVPMSTSIPPPVPEDHHILFGEHSMSSSVPHNMHSALNPATTHPDVNRARSSSYPAPATATQPPSFPQPIFYHPHPGQTFQVPYQNPLPHPLPPAPAPGVAQSVISLTWVSPQTDSQSTVPSATGYPTASSPSASSPLSSASDLSVSGSPCSSSSSLSPPPSTSRTTFRWRLSSSSHSRSEVDGYGSTWHCKCEKKTQKRKRHLESCPSNPNPPKVKCPYCSQWFKGGSRGSAMTKHIKRFHKKEYDESKRKGRK